MQRRVLDARAPSLSGSTRRSASRSPTDRHAHFVLLSPSLVTTMSEGVWGGLCFHDNNTRGRPATPSAPIVAEGATKDVQGMGGSWCVVFGAARKVVRCNRHPSSRRSLRLLILPIFTIRTGFADLG